MTPERQERSRKKKLLEKARLHWTECQSDTAEKENRERGKEDAIFSAGGEAGEQWHPAVWEARHQQGKERPCVTVNKCQSLLHKIENEVRENKISIKIKNWNMLNDFFLPMITSIKMILLLYIYFMLDPTNRLSVVNTLFLQNKHLN